MEEVIVQNDGLYALCFKNFKKLDIEAVDKLFNKYGDVVSIRQSSESIPWVFIRYKLKEEAQKARDDLQGHSDFEIRVAKSFSKKKQDQDGDREKSNSFLEGSRENRSMKGSQNKNRSSERFIMDSEDNDSLGARGSPKKAPYNRKINYAERPNKDKEEDSHSDRVDEVECARALFTKMEMVSSKNQKYSNGREDSESCRKSVNSSPPRLVKKSNHRVNGEVENWKQPDDCPPNLVKGSEYYGLGNSINSTRGLALRAAFEEVWANHPLRGKMQLREVLMTNFEHNPSKKDIYSFCSPIEPVHVSFGRTCAQSVFCRVLVTTEEEVEVLCNLSGTSGVTVTTVEEILDVIFLDDNVE